MKLTIVIVNYNVKYYVEQCLYSLRKALTGIDAQVCVVDNCSSDDSTNYLKTRFSEVTYIQNDENVGFSRANNIAIRQTESDYILLLNPDTMVAENTIREALAFMDNHPKAGAMGVKMLNTNGSIAKESRRGIPSPSTAFYKMCGLCERYPNNHRLAHYYMSYLPWDEAGKIEVVSGAFCLLRRSALKQVGLLDEDFFMYGEDIDLSFRIFNSGWEVWYYPASILHYKGESTQKTSFRYVHVFYEAMLIFFQKHYSHLSSLLSFPIKTAIYFKAFSTLLHVKLDKLYAFVKNDKLGVAQIPKYTIITNDANSVAAKAIATRYHLEATILTNMSQIDYAKMNDNSPHFAIFDIEVYGCKEIFSHFSSTSHHKIKIGFFNPKTRTIITENQVYQDE